jgi:hypothetical protein
MSQQPFGDDVLFQQRFLKAAGLYAGDIDGDWGPRTDAAHDAFLEQSARITERLGRFDARTEGNLQTLHLPVQSGRPAPSCAACATPASMPGWSRARAATPSRIDCSGRDASATRAGR